MKPFHGISLGAGVQSSTMALMAAHGELTPMPDVAIFADTQDEPAKVYDWLNWLEKHLPFPLIRVTKGKLSEHATRVRISKKSGMAYTKPSLPVFTAYLDEREGGKMSRHCTADFKITLILREMKRLASDRPIIQWLGISADEIIRMKPSKDPRIENIFPLIDRETTRDECLIWMRSSGYPEPPRSACIYCPYHSDSEWMRIKAESPEEFNFAVEFEKRLQKTFESLERIDSVPFLHASRIPLSDVVLSESANKAGFERQAPCQGMCGV